MSDYKRDKATGALIFDNPNKEKEIIAKRTMVQEIRHLKEEINILKQQVSKLISERE